jgi:cupin 2 domain-containing protein
MPPNIFKNIPEQLPEELFETLLKGDQLHIERIVSKGHVTEEGYWYDQDGDEWVLLLQGQAVISYENLPSVSLAAGDYMLIPAHTRHRVAWTANDVDTVWLAVHLMPASRVNVDGVCQAE